MAHSVKSADKQQIVSLIKAVEAHANERGEEVLQLITDSCIPLLRWCDFLDEYRSCDTAKELLNGVRAAMREVAGCIIIGLGRAALFPMRAEIDMLLSWIYYKDHPIEWNHLGATASGFMQRKDIVDYLNSYYPRSKTRFQMLQQQKARQHADPWAILSAHAHRQMPATLLPAKNLADVVEPGICTEAITLQADVSEYLNDVLLSCLVDRWENLPDVIRDPALKRLTRDQQRAFFQEA